MNGINRSQTWAPPTSSRRNTSKHSRCTRWTLRHRSWKFFGMFMMLGDPGMWWQMPTGSCHRKSFTLLSVPVFIWFFDFFNVFACSVFWFLFFVFVFRIFTPVMTLLRKWHGAVWAKFFRTFVFRVARSSVGWHFVIFILIVFSVRVDVFRLSLPECSSGWSKLTFVRFLIFL